MPSPCKLCHVCHLFPFYSVVVVVVVFKAKGGRALAEELKSHRLPTPDLDYYKGYTNGRGTFLHTSGRNTTWRFKRDSVTRQVSQMFDQRRNKCRLHESGTMLTDRGKTTLRPLSGLNVCCSNGNCVMRDAGSHRLTRARDYPKHRQPKNRESVLLPC